MRPLTARLEDDHCSITVANHRLIIIIRFVVKSYTHLWKDFENKIRLVLHACKIIFSGIMCRAMIVKSKQGHGSDTRRTHLATRVPCRPSPAALRFVPRKLVALPPPWGGAEPEEQEGAKQSKPTRPLASRIRPKTREPPHHIDRAEARNNPGKARSA